MSKPLSELIYDSLLDDILNNRLVAGEFINRRDIAKKMNVSVAPVLEAMVLLENDGLLETMPRKGTRVRIIRDDDVSGYLMVREALECMVARIICGKQISQAMPDLMPLAISVDESPPLSIEYYTKDHHFHNELVKLVGNDVLYKEYQRNSNLGTFYSTNRFLTREVASTRYSHRELLEQLAVAEPDEAYHIMREHVISAKGHLVKTR